MIPPTESHLKRMPCGCPEQFRGGWCPACHGTGQVPPVAHPPIRRLPWSTEIACDGNHEEADI